VPTQYRGEAHEGPAPTRWLHLNGNKTAILLSGRECTPRAGAGAVPRPKIREDRVGRKRMHRATRKGRRILAVPVYYFDMPSFDIVSFFMPFFDVLSLLI
jgi:hypothetical protein